MKWSDQLLRHLRTCPRCVAAKAMRRPSDCTEAHRLITLALKERHG